MGKDPAFLFYPGDWLGGTIGMTFEEKGAYMELLMMQFNRGHMTSHMIGQVVGQHWVKLQDKFVQDEDGLWYNVRLDQEKEKRKTFVKTRKNNLSGKNQYTKPDKNNAHMNGHMTSHMENENENRDTYKNGGEAWDEIKSDEQFIERLRNIVRVYGATEENVLKATKYFLTLEDAKPNFDLRPRYEVRKHLVNWLSKQKKNVTTY
jgi:uncharacterized protein YdaU (DUF1376 family)